MPTEALIALIVFLAIIVLVRFWSARKYGQQQARTMELLQRNDELQQRESELLARWEAVVTRMETVLASLERRLSL
jgi:uncharacterized membrane-anchored protein YhcB (DUF1043 family)